MSTISIIITIIIISTITIIIISTTHLLSVAGAHVGALCGSVCFMRGDGLVEPGGSMGAVLDRAVHPIPVTIVIITVKGSSGHTRESVR